MARSEDELALFRKVDKERHERLLREGATPECPDPDRQLPKGMVPLWLSEWLGSNGKSPCDEENLVKFTGIAAPLEDKSKMPTFETDSLGRRCVCVWVFLCPLHRIIHHLRSFF